MSDSARDKTETALKEAEAVTSSVLPEPDPELESGKTLTPERKAEIERRVAELDMEDSQSIIRFGSASQAELQTISGEMLEGVRNKDVGPAGDSLREMVASIRGFNADELDPDAKPSLWRRLMGKTKPVADIVARYEDVRGQIDGITDRLLGHETQLLKDIKSLDRLYETSLEFYHELALYIAAGEEKLRRLDAEDIPRLAREAEAAEGDEAVIKSQSLRDLRAARDDLERRVHDLKLTRQVTMQSLPSIRLVQENDKGLVNKINSTLVNTVPLWETQLAQAVTIHRSREAAGSVRQATELTNELLTKNAANLKTANREVREQMERGVFDIENVREANRDLIDTIEESLAIAEEGKRKRAEAETELKTMEGELRGALSAAQAPRTASRSRSRGSG